MIGNKRRILGLMQLKERSRARYGRRHPLNALKTNAMFLAHAAGLYARMMIGISNPSSSRTGAHSNVWVKARMPIGSA